MSLSDEKIDNYRRLLLGKYYKDCKNSVDNINLQPQLDFLKNCLNISLNNLVSVCNFDNKSFQFINDDLESNSCLINNYINNADLNTFFKDYEDSKEKECSICLENLKILDNNISENLIKLPEYLTLKNGTKSFLVKKFNGTWKKASSEDKFLNWNSIIDSEYKNINKTSSVCGHFIHLSCLKEYLKSSSKNKCPVCKTTLDKEFYDIKNILNGKYNNFKRIIDGVSTTFEQWLNLTNPTDSQYYPTPEEKKIYEQQYGVIKTTFQNNRISSEDALLLSIVDNNINDFTRILNENTTSYYNYNLILETILNNNRNIFLQILLRKNFNVFNSIYKKIIESNKRVYDKASILTQILNHQNKKLDLDIVLNSNLSTSEKFLLIDLLSTKLDISYQNIIKNLIWDKENNLVELLYNKNIMEYNNFINDVLKQPLSNGRKFNIIKNFINKNSNRINNKIEITIKESSLANNYKQDLIKLISSYSLVNHKKINNINTTKSFDNNFEKELINKYKIIVQIIDSLKKKKNESVIQQAVIQQAVIQQAVIQQAVIQQPVIQQPVIQQQITENNKELINTNDLKTYEYCNYPLPNKQKSYSIYYTGFIQLCKDPKIIIILCMLIIILKLFFIN